MLSPDVFEYLDYRKLLTDFYQTKKSEKRGFSFRSFSRRAGLRSPNHLKRVMDGQRNLSADSTSRYVTAMGLDGEKAEYFAQLVRFNQARTHSERERSYDQLRAFRGYQRAQTVDHHFAEYHSSWFVPVIREMALRKDFRAEPEWIASRLRPAIEVGDAKRALKVLVQLGLLVVDEDGGASLNQTVLTTGEQTRGLHMRLYHQTVLERAAASMELIPADERYLSALTFCTSAGGFERIRQRVQQFRQELVGILAEEDDGDEVLHLGIQLFPMSSRKTDES
ncbi:MAG: hypothetical protein ACI9KE_003834 [Polyangiales bacterium]|jgi:uncharacterized protein (TIGR02147 family)